MEYTIQLSAAENLALSYVVLQQQGWIENAVKSRCSIVIDEIMQIVINNCIETNTQIPNTKEDMVLLAFDQGWVESAEARELKFQASLQK